MRRRASTPRDPRFAFGTWKIEVLGGFASAIFLLGVAALMVVGSVERILSPQPIHYQEAIVVAVLGLVVNVVCALILGQAHDHHHAWPRSRTIHHDHDHHHDLNLRSAYLHVIADAATSVLAIVALIGGWIYGWSWLDPVMGIVGAVLVAIWARGLLVETGKVLLDREMDHPVVGGNSRGRRNRPGCRRHAHHRPACLARRQGRLFLRAQRAHPRPGADAGTHPRAARRA